VKRQRWMVGFLGTLAVGLVACSGPSSAPPSSKVPSSSSSELPTSTTSLEHATTTMGAVANHSPCRISQLRIAPGEGGAAAGSIGQTILFTNISQSPCTMTGYPGVAALDAQGNQVVQARRELRGMLGGLQNSGTPLPVVTLLPGDPASAEVEGDDVPIGTETSCPVYPSFLVTPPGETYSATIVVGATGSNTPGFQGCGAISVNPVVPGVTGRLS
jgi:hypothetical protein